jgi:hypothetical protein
MQGVFRQEIDMVADEHEIADFKIGVDTACGITYKKFPNTEFIHYAYGKSYRLHVIAFVVVETAFQSHYLTVAQFAEKQAAGMPLNGRYGEIGNRVVRKSVNYVNLRRQAAESGSQYDGCRRA